MYIYKSFLVYFHLSSDTGPNMCFFFFGGIGTFVFVFFFLFFFF